MTREKQDAIITLRKSGMAFDAIARVIYVSEEDVAEFCLRYRARITRQQNPILFLEPGSCKECGLPIVYDKKRTRPKIFCCEKCKTTWWSRNRRLPIRAGNIEKPCERCGKLFWSAKSAKQKYCSRECFLLRNYPVLKHKGGE